MQIMTALRESLKQGYSWSDFIADFMAGLVVAAVAVPLGMALAIASGVPPQHGLYTVIIAGGTVALLGGSRFQVTGPTAAFVVILLPIIRQLGLGGLSLAVAIAGILLFLAGVFRLGPLIHKIPHPVMVGFTAGIAVVIGVLQLKDFCGLTYPSHHPSAEHFLGKLKLLLLAWPTFSWKEWGLGMGTLFILMTWPLVNSYPLKKIPAPVVALLAASLGAIGLQYGLQEGALATLANRFTYDLGGGHWGHGIPAGAPSWQLPWSLGDASGQPLGLTWAVFIRVFPSALFIAALGGVESLLSARIADRMTQTQHDSNAELMALGIGNGLCAFTGGIAATGALARTSTNIRYGARSPLAAIWHAVFTLGIVSYCSRWVGYLPLASLSALLILVAYRMSDWREFVRVHRQGNWQEKSVLWVSFILTVGYDMVIGVTAGFVLALGLKFFSKPS